MNIDLSAVEGIRIEPPKQVSECSKCLPYSTNAEDPTHCTQDKCWKWESPARIVIVQRGDIDENFIVVKCWPDDSSDDFPIVVD